MTSLHLALLFVLLSIAYCQLFPSLDAFSGLTALKNTNVSDPKAVADKSLSATTQFIPFGNLIKLPGAAGGGAAAPTAGGLPPLPNLFGR